MKISEPFVSTPLSLHLIIHGLTLIDLGVFGARAPPNSPALTPCTTSPETLHVPAVCRDLDVCLIDLAKDIFGAYYPLILYDSHFDSGILSRPWVPCDVSLLPTHIHRAYISLAPSFAPMEEHNDIIVYKDERSYATVADAMADDCNIYFYRGMLYNIPADANSPPPFVCVTSGRYIGVFSGQ